MRLGLGYLPSMTGKTAYDSYVNAVMEYDAYVVLYGKNETAFDMLTKINNILKPAMQSEAVKLQQSADLKKKIIIGAGSVGVLLLIVLIAKK